ncbi:TonB-dependent receptor [Cellulophaga sp. HaHa_2_95]|uniref:SusC/RagA family TonB-linked outer membrane protein n=1 Tax=Cellulophaga TaxID=104264 RepID=UPI001C4FC37B|nr:MULTISPECIES: TonB-dependent receptor [unclassified Cellulophaga]QXP50482.1 TonB-dependent receptor [Cellulophaga sp. HaHa_2_1]QXP57207.1 TonB-dependent receptor [Cellulophaga sp. HaHa_2_95]
MKSKLTWILTPLLALMMSFSFAQEKTITGTVTDESGLPLPGVSVLVVGTTKGTQTDFDGNYAIVASQGQQLRFSYVGQKTVEKLVGSLAVINVQLLEDAQALEEIVVVAYGSQTKEKIVQNVAIVGEAALENLVVTSPDQLLQGQAAGVNVTNTSGLLGANVNIQVRGVNTINGGSSPLFVVDGVVITDNDNTFSRGGNVGSNPLTFLNPSDIQSLTVLKDAGATAIYGTRGANGVVLITTKKGRLNSDATVTVNNYIQASKVNDLFEGLTADEYRQFRTDVANIQDGTSLVPQDLGLGAIGDPGTDFVDEISRTGFTEHIDVSVRGGSDKTTYFISGSYEDAESFAIGNDLTRSAVRMNLETQAKKWLKVGTNIGITNTLLNSIGRENSTFAPFTSAFLLDPTFIPRDADGNFVRSPSFIPNIAAVAALDTDRTEATRTIGSIYGEITLAPGLKFRSEFGADRLVSETSLRSTEIVSAGGSSDFFTVTDNLYRVTNSLSYANTFADKHNFNALVLQEYEERQRRFTQIDGVGFLSDDQLNVGAATTQTVLDSDRAGSAIRGFLGRISYDYDSKYLLEVTGRVDESSRLGIDNNTGKFYSVAAGWTVSNEDFFKLDFVDFLTLRGSIGTAGNDRLGNFPSLALYEAGQFGGLSTANVISPANTTLGFEQTRTIDFGFRSSYFNNRLNLNVSYYKRNTTDLLFQVPLPNQSGAATVNLNAGELENSGWEFELSSTNFKTDNFQWDTSLNLATLDNKLVDIVSNEVDADGRKFIETGAQRAIEGESLSTFFLVRYNGINPDTGDAEWLDVDGNVTTTPNFDTDRVEVGSALPDLTGGLTNTFRYKNFDFSSVFNFSVGNKVLIEGLRFVDGIDAIGGTINVRRENLDFWRNPGDVSFAPSPASATANNFNQESTAQLLDGDYLRLKNITLGYSLPTQALEKVGFLSKVRFYATATNLWTIKGDDLDGIDPENNDSNDPLSLGQSFFTAPQAVTYLLGLNLQF